MNHQYFNVKSIPTLNINPKLKWIEDTIKGDDIVLWVKDRDQIAVGLKDGNNHHDISVAPDDKFYLRTFGYNIKDVKENSYPWNHTGPRRTYNLTKEEVIDLLKTYKIVDKTL